MLKLLVGPRPAGNGDIMEDSDEGIIGSGRGKNGDGGYAIEVLPPLGGAQGDIIGD